MEKTVENPGTMMLSEERLKLEREALAVERERLDAARTHLEAAAKLQVPARPRAFTVLAVILLVVLAFAGGLLLGISLAQTRQQRDKDARLAQAFSRLNTWADGPANSNRVSVLIIQ